MASSNRYSPPKSEVSDINSSEDFQPIKLWSATGRIGRLRYLAYATAATMITLFVGGVAGAILIPVMGSSALPLVYLPYIPLFVFNILTVIKRSHDMNWSGWTTLIAMFIPFAAFIWMFKSGSDGENDYGAPPPPNSTSVKVLGVLFPIVMIAIIGILAAIAIPAYQKYVQRAQQAQQHMQQR